jgi:hypothetical protein
MKPAGKRPWRKPNEKNRVDSGVEQAAVDFAYEQPAYGRLRVSNELKKQGILVSPGGERSIWLRHDKATFKGRLRALEAKTAQENLILTESRRAALERAKEAHGEIETEHPGYLGAQDMRYSDTPEQGLLAAVRCLPCSLLEANPAFARKPKGGCFLMPLKPGP